MFVMYGIMDASMEDETAVNVGMEVDEKEAGDIDSDSDDSVPSEDDEVGETKKEQIRLIKKQLSENAYQYEKHVELIDLLKGCGELEGLRDARQRMSDKYPLSVDLWLSWLKDEVKLVSAEDEREFVLQLFERAVKDYVSPVLWLEYATFSIGGMGAAGGIDKVRDVFERALSAVGLHVSDGATIWEAYREFEHAILSGLQPMPGAVATAEQQESINSQTSRVLSLFKRQLAVPLMDMAQTLEEYREWDSAEEADQAVIQVYQKAEAKLQQLIPFEEALLTSDPPHLAEYQKYIEHEVTEGEPARVQCVYERAITENCLVTDLWYNYTKYLDRELRIGDVCLAVHERAVRNCPWSGDLWTGYLRALERHKEPHSKVLEVFQQALGVGLTQPTELLQLWTAHCDYMRRRVDFKSEHEKEGDQLRQTFDQAINYMSQCFGLEGDPMCTVYRYWANIEALHFHNMEKTRELWNEVLQQGHSSEAQMWLEFINLERHAGDHKHLRKILQRALNSSSDWPESIVEVWLNFEREEGSLEQYDTAVIRCEQQMSRVEQRRQQAAEKEKAQLQQKKKEPNKKAAGKPVHKKNVPATRSDQRKDDAQNGFKVPQKVAPKPYTSKSAEKQNISTETPGDFKVPSLPPPEVKRKSAPPPGYKGPVQGPTQHPEEEPEAKKRRVEEPDEADSTDSQQMAPHSDDKTVFISNLDFNLSVEKITEVFNNTGEIQDIRLMKNQKGKSKGYGYVEFKTVEEATEALKLDRIPVEGRPMYVSKCRDKAANEAKFKYSTEMEKNKLFVKGLPFTCTKEALNQIFSQHGKLKEVRMVTYKSGAPKGLAYIVYEQESDATQAVMKTDGLMIGEHKISVAISNPPERKQPLTKRPESTFTPSLGGGKRETSERGKARTQLAMMPRSLAKPATKQADPRSLVKPATESTTAEPKQEDSKKMSNQDFRAMLLKK